jgi:hypothetical protein
MTSQSSTCVAWRPDDQPGDVCLTSIILTVAVHTSETMEFLFTIKIYTENVFFQKCLLKRMMTDTYSAQKDKSFFRVCSIDLQSVDQCGLSLRALSRNFFSFREFHVC